MTLILAALLLTASLQHANQQHICMANAVWYEARGESLKGRRAVVDVILNRTKAEKRGVCSVIFRKGQFTWAKPLWDKSKGYKWQNLELMRLTPEKAALYRETMSQKPVLKNNTYVYFSRGYQYGGGCVRINAHLFCKGEL